MRRRADDSGRARYRRSLPTCGRASNLLVNGSSGIAVGMATNIPPHNLSEVIDGTCYVIDHPEAELDEICQFIKGPDFPTGGVIMSAIWIIEMVSSS